MDNIWIKPDRRLCTEADLITMIEPKPTPALPVVRLYMVDKDNPQLFIDNCGRRTTNRKQGLDYKLDAWKRLIPPDGMTWRYVRSKK